MHRRTRYVALTCILVLTLVALYRKYSPIVVDGDPDYFPLTGEIPDSATSTQAALEDPIEPTIEPAVDIPPHRIVFDAEGRANATFIMLARNSDLKGALLSLRQLEDRFNRRFNYPHVFLNEEEFTDDFKRQIRNLTPSQVEFGVIPSEHWYQPEWIDDEKAQEAMKQMARMNVKYGGNLAYHNMCRFNSGFFFKHPLVQKYQWYWRVEPNVKFHCDISQDPFRFMVENNKTYGFTLAVYEIPATIRSLWGHVKDFMAKYPEYIRDEDNALKFISNDRGGTYSRCHFWSNFEIASLDFWRSEAYSTFFDYLDATGGFYYERWGDAPVHSIAAALMLSKSQIHLFEDIGYQHDDWSHCPQTQELWEAGRCMCSRHDSFDYSSDSCRRKWDALGVD
ncbi:glycosyltransferase family 15 protein [Mycena maculata]|uniref:Glycosyltransferase family 15 protein n=1 Tax=Mycena maculata TaxID=230809 RepID=A0AAD7J0R5_9AGAR|nr:glycosyltransferase family 15 protein [Mycena maculata]